jgi:hypothetical protein
MQTYIAQYASILQIHINIHVHVHVNIHEYMNIYVYMYICMNIPMNMHQTYTYKGEFVCMLGYPSEYAYI